MADDTEKRTLLGDLKKNIFDKVGNENIMEGDITRYKIPDRLSEVPIKKTEKKNRQIESFFYVITFKLCLQKKRSFINKSNRLRFIQRSP